MSFIIHIIILQNDIIGDSALEVSLLHFSNRQRLNIFRRYLWPSELAIQYALNDYEMLNDKPDLWLYCDETGYKIPSGSTGESHVIIMEEIIQTMRNSYTRGIMRE